MKKETIGRATLYLGDCLEILPTLPKVDAVITDPPYNVGKDYGTHNDAMDEHIYKSWCASVVCSCLLQAPNQFWVAPRYKLEMWLRLLQNSHLIVIPRGASGPFRQGWSDQFEIALAIGKPSRCASDLWSGIRLKGEGYFFREDTYGHPGYTPYPIMERAVELFAPSSLIDPFMGTGTSGEAAIKNGRTYYGVEINEPYFNISCERIYNVQRQERLFA